MGLIYSESSVSYFFQISQYFEKSEFKIAMFYFKSMCQHMGFW